MVDQTNNQSEPLIIWCFKDGKIGHEKQSLGLINALGNQRPCEIHEFCGLSSFESALWLLKKQFPPQQDKPQPDLIIAAGHQTHVPMLAAARIGNAKTIVLMKPSMPLALFDLCLIPKHDRPPKKKNIVETEGAISNLTPSDCHEKNTGLILVGGPSKHYAWDVDDCLRQIKTILEKQKEVRWFIGNSRRTTEDTSKALASLKDQNQEFIDINNCSPDWLAQQMTRSEFTWVSEDSVSMVYESISARCKTGILKVNRKNKNKISDSVASLISRGMVIGFDDWLRGKALTSSETTLNEADRCAQIILKRFFNDR